MQRPRPIAFSSGLALAIVVLPLLAAVTLAADPSVTVRPGDTLTAISKRHGVSIEELVTLNAIDNPNRIYPGQRLRLAAAAARPGPKPPAAAPAAAPAARVHVVRSGENLTWIGRRYGVTVAAIVGANRLVDPSRIHPGQRLTIPGAPGPTAPAPAAARPGPKPPAAAPAAAPAARVHVVRSGENLTWIGRRYGVTVAAIVGANRLVDPSRIHPGQRLTIPGGTPAPTVRAAPRPLAPLPAATAAAMARRDDVRRLIVAEAKRFRVPTPLALAVAWHESGWRQGVVSSAGAIGVMQVMPATAEWVGESMFGTTVNLRDVRHNVRTGVRLLAHYLDRYDGNRDLVLAAYYQGQAAADRHGIYPMSRLYIASIRALERMLGG